MDPLHVIKYQVSNTSVAISGDNEATMSSIFGLLDGNALCTELCFHLSEPHLWV